MRYVRLVYGAILILHNPCFQAFATLSDKLEPLVEGVRDNRGHWIDLADVVKTKTSQDQEPQDQAEERIQDQQNVISNGDCRAMSDDDVAVEPEPAEQISVNGLNVANSCTTNNNIAVASRPTSTSTQQPSDDDDAKQQQQPEQRNGHEDSEVECHLSNSSCSSSTASSRLSTPPPTGEDDSTPVSPSKTLQAKLVVNALQRQTSVGQAAQKQRCKSCDQSRSGLQVRKTSSLRGALEMDGLDSKARNDTAAALCKSTPVIHHQSHSHHNHHHHHHHHHSHHTHGQHGVGIGSASIGGSGLISLATPLLAATESDRIPKIVGKIGNLDGLPFANGIGSAQNGHGLPFGTYQHQHQIHHHHHHLLTRRHSETNSNGATAVAAEK